MADVSLSDLTAWLGRFSELVTANRDYLTELDSAIGDADHGSNMSRGMAAVMEKLSAATPTGAAGPDSTTVGELFKSVGMTLVTSVGGASGPLYGTFFLRMGTTAGAADSLDAPALGAALQAGYGGVLQRGKAELGDKTMVDAMSPALDAYNASVADGGSAADAASAAFAAAETGRDATTPLVARKGRASYLGDRSVDHLDPGATSTAFLFQALSEVLAA